MRERNEPSAIGGGIDLGGAAQHAVERRDDLEGSGMADPIVRRASPLRAGAVRAT